MKIKHIGMVLLLLGVAFLYFFIDPGEVDFLPKCLLFETTGIYCPGCGSQRATHQLLNLNFLGVLQQNVLYVVALLILGYHLFITALNLYIKQPVYNYLYHPKTPLLILIFIVLFWILRNIPYYPFNLLAPK